MIETFIKPVIYNKNRLGIVEQIAGEHIKILSLHHPIVNILFE